MFYIKDVNSGEKPAVEDRKIADYILAPKSDGEGIKEQHKIRGIYLEQRDSGGGGLKEVSTGASERYTFFPYFSEQKRQNHRLLVSGRSGSGKSFLIGMILDQMKHLYPKHDIIIISFVEEDESLDRERNGRAPLRLNLQDSELFNITPAFFQDSITVWDDVERGTDKNVVKFLMNLRAMCFETARHYNNHIISVSHDLLGGSMNKTVRAESTGCVLFPAFNQRHQSETFLRKYVGLSKNQILEIMSLPSRWVFISLLAPTYYITPEKVKLLV